MLLTHSEGGGLTPAWYHQPSCSRSPFDRGKPRQVWSSSSGVEASVTCQLAWLLSPIPLLCQGVLWGHFYPHLSMYFCSHDQESLLTVVYFIPLLILGHLNGSYFTLSILFPTGKWMGLQTESRWDAEHKYYTGTRRINEGLLKKKLTLH